jgi:putative ABC transport system substrate-binding protein
MRRSEFVIGLLLAAATQSVRAQDHATQHRIAIVMAGGTIARISETASDPVARRFYQAFFQELRRLGDVEGQNLTIERYSDEGRPARAASIIQHAVSFCPSRPAPVRPGSRLAATLGGSLD